MFKFSRRPSGPSEFDILQDYLVTPLNRIISKNLKITPDQDTYSFIFNLADDLGRDKNFPEKFAYALLSFADWHNTNRYQPIRLQPIVEVPDLIKVNETPTTFCKQAKIFIEYIAPLAQVYNYEFCGSLIFAPYIKNRYHRFKLIQFTSLAEQYNELITSKRWLFHTSGNIHFIR